MKEKFRLILSDVLLFNKKYKYIPIGLVAFLYAISPWDIFSEGFDFTNTVAYIDDVLVIFCAIFLQPICEALGCNVSNTPKYKDITVDTENTNDTYSKLMSRMNKVENSVPKKKERDNIQEEIDSTNEEEVDDITNDVLLDLGDLFTSYGDNYIEPYNTTSRPEVSTIDVPLDENTQTW